MPILGDDTHLVNTITSGLASYINGTIFTYTDGDRAVVTSMSAWADGGTSMKLAIYYVEDDAVTYTLLKATELISDTTGFSWKTGNIAQPCPVLRTGRRYVLVATANSAVGIDGAWNNAWSDGRGECIWTGWPDLPECITFGSQQADPPEGSPCPECIGCTTQEECEENTCFWYSGGCHFYPEAQFSDFFSLVNKYHIYATYHVPGGGAGITFKKTDLKLKLKK